MAKWWRGEEGVRRLGPEGQVLYHALWYVLRHVLRRVLRRVLHVLVFHVLPKSSVVTSALTCSWARATMSTFTPRPPRRLARAPPRPASRFQQRPAPRPRVGLKQHPSFSALSEFNCLRAELSTIYLHRKNARNLSIFSPP